MLIYKSTKEIYHITEITNEDNPNVPLVGMVQELWVMYAAVVVAVVIMLFASKPISEFIRKHPSFKILALCFLMMIGVSLLAEGFHFEIPKGYIYFSMAFAFIVDVIQMKMIKHK